jgi:hypothetical protein
MELMQAATVPEDNWDDAIDLLCEATFLGLEIHPNEFRFLYDTEGTKKKVYETLARRTADTLGEERFRINTPFQSFLEIETGSHQSMMVC